MGLFQRVGAAMLCGLLAAAQATATESPFAGGWTLVPENSSISFQSTKNETKVETSRFATFTGTIGEDGTARLEIALDSVDTGIDLRNVRMRFLFFESFQFPQATVTVDLDPEQLSDLPQLRRKVLRVPFELDLHGVKKAGEADVVVTLLTEDLVNVSTPAPIVIHASDYNLMGGVQKLEEAAQVDILPQGAVTFDLTFARNGQAAVAAAPTEAPQEEAPAHPLAGTGQTGTTQGETGQAAPAEGAPAPQTAALEPEGVLSPEACKGRFEILSRTDNIHFRSGSARLDADSRYLLDTLHDIISRCPGMVIEVGGHTDDVGSDAANQRLSERRAAAVVRYLVEKGIAPEALVARGYGEAEPAFDNATPDGRRRNRRIEFKVISE